MTREVWLPPAELARAGGPCLPTLHCQQLLAAVDLLGFTGLMWVPAAANHAPGRQAELDTAVVTVAGVDGPVSV